MTSDADDGRTVSNRIWRLLLWVLRMTVVLQCVGNWRWMTQLEETPLLHWLLAPADVGGLAWSEPTALAAQQTVGWLVLLAAATILWRPHVAALAPLVAVQSLIAVAMWRIAAGYSLQASWAPPQLLTFFPFATELARIAAPLGLLLLQPRSVVRPHDHRPIERTMQLLRWAIAIVFLAHGVEAWQQNPKFVDLQIHSLQRLFGIDITQSMAEQSLRWIGGVDIVLAIACVSFRWLTVLWWMAVWGGVTAVSRLVANGWEISCHEALVRTPHIGIPLAIVLWWHLLKCKSATALAMTDDRSTLLGINKVPQPTRSRTLVLWCFVMSAVAVGSHQSSTARADAVLEGVNPAQWRLVWNSDPATSATLCWSTALPGRQHRVHLRREEPGESTEAAAPGEIPKQIVVEAQRSGRYSAASPNLYYHHAQLSDLEPATKYHVVMESDGQQSPALYFVTAPSRDVPVSLLFGADSRSGLRKRRQMNAMLAKIFAESYAAKRVPIVAFAHGGDFVVDGRQLNLWSQWMSDHELTVTSDGRLLPIIPARGNHDGGEMFNEVFAFPPKDGNYYSLDLGPQVRFVTLNTETSLSGDQLEWLKAELPSSRSQRRWLLAQYHRPAFPAVKVPGLNLVHWVPLFEEHNVDLVCEGDGHNIKRTAPIRDYKIDPSGVVYIGEGGLGVGQRTPKAGRWYLNSPQAKTGQAHHVQLLTFDEAQLSCRVIMLGGEVFDEHYQSARTLTNSQDPQ